MPTVIAQSYSTAGNGGRKLVRLSNGNLFSIVKDGTNKAELYKSANNGTTWASFGTIDVLTLNDVTIATDGIHLFAMIAYDNASILVRKYDGAGNQLNNPQLVVNETALGNVSLAIDPTNGHLHAAWSSKNSSFPNSYNIRYSKSTDGGVTWSAVEQVTKVNLSDANYSNPSIIIRRGIPYILYQNSAGGGNLIRVLKRGGSLNVLTSLFDSNWSYKDVYHGSSYVQSNPSAVVDKDGVIHVAWHAADPNYSSQRVINYSKSTDGGVSWSARKVVHGTASTDNLNASITVDKNNKLAILYYNGSSQVQKAISTDGGTNWSISFVASGSSTPHPSTLYDAYFLGIFGDTPPLIYQTATTVEYIGTYTTNQAPTLTLSTADAQTLYETDIFAISGLVTDVNSGDVVSVKYSIDGGTARAILANVSTGSAISYAKNLTYKSGMLYDGATAITSALAEGSQHTIKVWAEDDKGGKSSEIIRSFYVVPNRAATLTLDAFVTRTGLINTDVVNISGKVADLDNGNVIVKYKIGNGAFVQVFNNTVGATPTPFNFNVLLADLVEGDNQITIQAVDAYNAITQQVLNIRKNKNEVPMLEAVTYYEVTPPNGTSDGLQLYIEREVGDLIVAVDVFMGAPGQSEVFVPMTLASTANLTNGNAEETFSYEHGSDASKIVVRIKMTRSSGVSNKAIKKISGVLT